MAQQLKEAGLAWKPAPGDRFAIPERDLDDEVFVLSNMTIEVHDLPPEVRATRRRLLSPLEAIECDAIIDALAQADGNKALAARSLGMSRATIYRKIRGFGIQDPSS